jgi:hypothetical protein
MIIITLGFAINDIKRFEIIVLKIVILNEIYHLIHEKKYIIYLDASIIMLQKLIQNIEKDGFVLNKRQ